MADQDHLAWCRTRALEYLDLNQPDQAWVSFLSDLTKTDEPVLMGTGTLEEGLEAVVLAKETGDTSVLRRLIEDYR